jgi:hypothetical protein
MMSLYTWINLKKYLNVQFATPYRYVLLVKILPTHALNKQCCLPLGLSGGKFSHGILLQTEEAPTGNSWPH